MPSICFSLFQFPVFVSSLFVPFRCVKTTNATVRCRSSPAYSLCESFARGNKNEILVQIGRRNSRKIMLREWQCAMLNWITIKWSSWHLFAWHASDSLQHSTVPIRDKIPRPSRQHAVQLWHVAVGLRQSSPSVGCSAAAAADAVQPNCGRRNQHSAANCCCLATVSKRATEVGGVLCLYDGRIVLRVLHGGSEQCSTSGSGRLSSATRRRWRGSSLHAPSF